MEFSLLMRWILIKRTHQKGKRASRLQRRQNETRKRQLTFYIKNFMAKKKTLLRNSREVVEGTKVNYLLNV